MSDHVLVTRQDAVTTVTLNRPEKFNALTFEMYERLAEICTTVSDDGSVRAIVITGAGTRAFAAGTDISLFRNFGGGEDGIRYEKNADETFSAIEACPVPTIAAIAGACTGGGAGIAGCCDMRIGTQDMKFGFPIARTLGNLLSGATLARLVNLVGEARVVDLIYTSRLIEADEALRLGIVTELCDTHEALMTRVNALANQIAGHAPLTLQATKEILRRARQAQPKVQDEDIVAKVYGSADFREGLEAFLAKRKPNWTGR